MDRNIKSYGKRLCTLNERLLLAPSAWLAAASLFTTPGKQPGVLFGYSLSLNANVSQGSWELGLLDGESLTLAAGTTHREENLLSLQYQTPFRQEACPQPLQKPSQGSHLSPEDRLASADQLLSGTPSCHLVLDVTHVPGLEQASVS